MERKRVLLAEDDEQLRQVLALLIEGEGHTCLQAASGEEGIALIQDNEIDLVITDFNMPRMNGSVILFWCRENNRKLPFIFITASNSRLPVELKALEDELSLLVKKPVSLSDLNSAIEAAFKNSK